MFNVSSDFAMIIHGYGGQGVKTLASLLAEASINHGLYAQAFPEFGPERRGAPVKAFVRISGEPITSRSPIEKPDFVIILDLNVLNLEEVRAGWTDETVFLISTDLSPKEVKNKFDLISDYHKINTIDISNFLADDFASVHPSIPVIGRFLGITELVPLDEVRDVLREKFLHKIGDKKMRYTDKVLTESYQMF
jgi:pyruvate ferredoxin oxidoreductase gamma subunit